MGLSAFDLASGMGSKTNPTGTLFVHVPFITSFLEHGILEPVVIPIPIILVMRMFNRFGLHGVGSGVNWGIVVLACTGSAVG